MNIRQGHIIYIMGVSGSGKTTIGEMLAARLELPYREADDFHPEANISKMKAGIPLNDEDRQPWLKRLRQEAEALAQHSGGVITCSALKQTYRDTLSNGIESYVKWIYLKGDYELLHNRMKARAHFMPAGLLQSQLDTLEEPKEAHAYDVSRTPEDIVESIIEILNQE